MEHARRPLQKITFGALRVYGVRGVLIYCADYHCSRLTAISAMGVDDLRLSDIEDPFTSSPARAPCRCCGSQEPDSRENTPGISGKLPT